MGKTTDRPHEIAIPGSACRESQALDELRARIPGSHIRALATTAKALADPNRLAILVGIERAGELCVGNLAELLRLEQSLISHHLRALRRSGLVATRREGTWTYYRREPNVLADTAIEMLTRKPA